MSLSCMGPCTWYVMEPGIVTVPVSGFYQQGNIGSCDINHADRVSTKYIDTPFFCFLSKALGNYPDYCSRRKLRFHQFGIWT